jgi:hypothetical protein
VTAVLQWPGRWTNGGGGGWWAAGALGQMVLCEEVKANEGGSHSRRLRAESGEKGIERRGRHGCGKERKGRGVWSLHDKLERGRGSRPAVARGMGWPMSGAVHGWQRRTQGKVRGRVLTGGAGVGRKKRHVGHGGFGCWAGCHGPAQKNNNFSDLFEFPN